MRDVWSPNQDERPAGVEVSLVVVHAISLPPGQFGGDAIERLFTNRLDPAAHPYFESVAHLRVSSHFLVRRDGALVRFVPVERRAWHAGASSWRGRTGCNDFSLGIELEGADDASCWRSCAPNCRSGRSPGTARSRPGARPIPGRGSTGSASY